MEHCSISRCAQRQLKGKTKLAFSWQHETEHYLRGVGVNAPTVDVVSVASYQLMNGTAPIMTWLLWGLSFNVDIVLSAQHHQVYNDTNTKLSTLGSVSLSSDYIFARTKRQHCVWVAPITKSNLWGSARISFVQTLLTQCPCAHWGPDQNVFVNVFIYNGTGIKDTTVSTVWTNFV